MQFIIRETMKSFIYRDKTMQWVLASLKNIFLILKQVFYSIGRHIVIHKGRNKVIELSVHLNVHMDLNRVQSISPILFGV